MISLREVDAKNTGQGQKKQKSAEAEAERELERKSALYVLHYSDSVVVLQNKQVPEEVLVVNRRTMESSFEPTTAALRADGLKKLSVYAVWGLVEISGVEFLVLVSKARVAARIGASEVYHVLSIKFVTLSIDKFKRLEFEQCWEQLKRMKNILKTGFFFSYSYALAAPFQGRTAYALRELSEGIAENVFVWNYKATKQLLGGLKGGFGFFVPFVQGFVGTCEVDGRHYFLLSRRAYVMGGTRFNNRGVDNLGHVANFVETEQLLETKNGWFNFRQIRGSMPFYWEQFKGIKVNVKVHQTEQINREVLARHFAFLAERGYSSVVMLNLLSARRGEEEGLTRYLGGLLGAAREQGLRGVEYEYVDFHSITRETDFSAVDREVVRIWNKYDIGYDEWHEDLVNGGLARVSQQRVFVRTNCLDCLDRTNATQTKFAFYALALVLYKLGSPLVPHIEPSILQSFEKSDQPAFKQLRSLWADNGDLISLIYAGTGATTSSVTRNGEKSNFGSIFDHGLKTISRFYLNNFDDDFKQDMIDSLLARQNTTIRHSVVELGEEREAARLSVVSLTSARNNSNLPLPEAFVSQLFRELADSAVALFLAYVHTDKPLVLDGKDHLVFATFAQLFRAFPEQTHGLVLTREYIGAKFECLVFTRAESPLDLSFFKAETVRSGFLSRPFGCRLSLIFRQTSLEVFAVKVDSGFISGSATQTIKALLDRYIHRQYDYIFFAGPMEAGVNMDNIHKNYALAATLEVKNPGDPDHANRLYTLVSLAMAERTTNVPLLYDSLDLGPALTVNSTAFILR